MLTFSLTTGPMSLFVRLATEMWIFSHTKKLRCRRLKLYSSRCIAVLVGAVADPDRTATATAVTRVYISYFYFFLFRNSPTRLVPSHDVACHISTSRDAVTNMYIVLVRKTASNVRMASSPDKKVLPTYVLALVRFFFFQM